MSFRHNSSKLARQVDAKWLLERTGHEEYPSSGCVVEPLWIGPRGSAPDFIPGCSEGQLVITEEFLRSQQQD